MSSEVEMGQETLVMLVMVMLLLSGKGNIPANVAKLSRQKAKTIGVRRTKPMRQGTEVL